MKQTEIGWIPEDWEVRELGEVGAVRMCKRIFQHQTAEYGEIPFFKIGTFGKEPDAFISRKLFEEFKSKFNYPKVGDILISAAGTIGRTVVYDGEERYYQDSNIVWIDNEENIISNRLLKYVLDIVSYNTEGGTIQRLYNSILRSTKFVLPPLTEQEAIAGALSDADAWIESLEQIIAKKRLIKQGAMQELLTPKEGWEVKKLGDFCEIIMGQSPLSEFYNSSGNGLPLVQGNADIENRKTIVRNYTSSITKKGKTGDIIMSVRAPVGEIARATFDCCLGRGVCAFRTENDFLYHLLIYKESSWAQFSTGSTFDSVNSNQIKELEIFIPKSLTEQTRIATILSDMDTELEALEQQLHKARQIKQGMMQELLTGRVRLI